MEGVQVFPSELKFNFELRKELTTTLTLSNAGPQRLAFKVLTTNPDKYCVRPCMGVIEPRGSLEAVVAMQAYFEVPHDLHNCEDVFLIQSKPAPPDLKTITEKTFPSAEDSGANGSVHQTRLPVRLELPDEDNPLLLNLALQTLGSGPDDPEGISDDDDDDEEGDSGGLEESGHELRRFFTANAEFASVAKDVLMDHLEKIMKERDELKRQVVILSPRGSPAQAEEVAMTPRQERRSAGLAWPVALAMAGSFLLGRLTA